MAQKDCSKLLHKRSSFHGDPLLLLLVQAPAFEWKCDYRWLFDNICNIILDVAKLLYRDRLEHLLGLAYIN